MAFEHGRTHAHPQGPGEQAVATGHGEESGGPVSTLLSLLGPQELVTWGLQHELIEARILPVGRARSTGRGSASGRELGTCSCCTQKPSLRGWATACLDFAWG